MAKKKAINILHLKLFYQELVVLFFQLTKPVLFKVTFCYDVFIFCYLTDVIIKIQNFLRKNMLIMNYTKHISVVGGGLSLLLYPKL